MSDDPQLELIKKKLKKIISTEQRGNEPFPIEKVEKLKSKLTHLFSTLEEEHDFSIGQFVTWKPGLKNKFKPRINEPAIVVKILDKPVFDKDQDSGSPYFMEPLNMVVGILDEEHDVFMLFHVDKRRFMSFT